MKESRWWRFHLGKAYRRRIQDVVQLRQPLSCYVNSFLVGLAPALRKQFPPRNIPSCPNTSPIVAAYDGDGDNEGKSHSRDDSAYHVNTGTPQMLPSLLLLLLLIYDAVAHDTQTPTKRKRRNAYVEHIRIPPTSAQPWLTSSGPDGALSARSLRPLASPSSSSAPYLCACTSSCPSCSHLLPHPLPPTEPPNEPQTPPNESQTPPNEPYTSSAGYGRIPERPCCC
ncbi:hypothetical protein EDB81DRAFT_898427 [Dactylonectria macrodidyma]|uniref:Uncharacterized protein n=1 Tax=Dactylonectria macrodidyma TaxID=307937 RepID=A0A9P9FVC0_9HYPO|nr:hypothetical protein EDB81DRAFT_898427 [Dactylonectria macrodidyma]